MATRRYTGDVPIDLEDKVRKICLALPDAREEQAWVGTRWKVRERTFAQVLGLVDDDSSPLVILAFRSEGEELEVLRNAGHPFLVLGWGRNALGMVLDASTDWEEVAELLTESFCAMAPRKLVTRVDRPGDGQARGSLDA